MVSVDRAEAAGEERPILPWRLVAGAFLHFIIPAYLVAALVDWQLPARAARAIRAGPGIRTTRVAL
jgi:hypothetical protein